MSQRLGGHALQVVGYGLVFLGLAVAAGAMAVAGQRPAVPLGVFVLAGVGVGGPLMVAGGRVNAVGRGRVLGLTPEAAGREYRAGTAVLAVYLTVLLAQGAWVAVPLAVCAAGRARPADLWVRVWVAGWLLAFCVGRAWITRPAVRWLGEAGR